MTSSSHGPAERADLVATLVRRLDTCRPSDVADLAIEELQRALGAADVVVYLVNLEETELLGVVSAHSPSRPLQDVETSTVGRCYTSGSLIEEPHRTQPPSSHTIWVPIRHGGLRFGVLEATVPLSTDLLVDEVGRTLLDVGCLIGQALLTKAAFGDDLAHARRSQEMKLGAELLDALLPPLAYATEDLSIAAMLEPAYSSGGDAFDYAIGNDVTHVAILDAMGHGFEAAMVSTVAITCYRNSRRLGHGLVETYQAMDVGIGLHGEEGRFATALLATFDTGTGLLRMVSAGHAPPLLIRHNSVVDIVEIDPVPPLGTGLGLGDPVVCEEYLEPGDILVFYTDGLSEARNVRGALLGVDGLVDLVQRSSEERRSMPELVRAIRSQLVLRDDAWLNDDATAVCLQWISSSAGGADVP